MQRYNYWPVYVFAVMTVTAAVWSCLCMTRYLNRAARILRRVSFFSVLGSGLHLVFDSKIEVKLLFSNALAVWIKDMQEELQ